MNIRERQLGVEHPRTAYIYTKLAYLYYTEERFEEAKSLYLKAITIYKASLAFDHPTIVEIKERYSTLLLEMQK